MNVFQRNFFTILIGIWPIFMRRWSVPGLIGKMTFKKVLK